MKIAPLLVLTAAALLSACQKDSPSGTEPEVDPVLAILAGANVTDTIGAVPAPALRLQVRGRDGKPAANTVVRVEAVMVGIGLDAMPEVLARPVGTAQFGTAAGEIADSMGIALFQLKLGTRPGPARLVVSVPSLGLQDTARFTVAPGAPATLTLLPADTVMRMGGSATLRTSLVDRAGNRLSVPITYSASGSGGTLSGTTVAGSGFGRVRVVAEAGRASDTSYVGFVPQGTVAAYTSPSNSGQPSAIYTFNLDGSEFREVRRTVVGPGYNGDMPVAWLGSGKMVYHDNNYNHTKQMYVLDLAAGTSQRFLPAADQMEMENFPRVGRDAGWVYFSGGTFWSWSIYRARPDGTGTERLTAPGNTKLWAASPSPDGTEIAYMADGDIGAGSLFVMTLATRQSRNLNLKGTMPRWSPDGTQIAFLAHTGSYRYSPGDLSVVAPNGSGARVVTRSTTKFHGAVDWSPDGKYLVGFTVNSKLAIVEVATGAEVPVSLPTDFGIFQGPVWKP
jgi:Tol biopolymer transport system component